MASEQTNKWQVSCVFLCVAEDMPTQKGDKMFAEGTFNKVRQDRGQGAISNPHSKERALGRDLGRQAVCMGMRKERERNLHYLFSADSE